MRLRLISLIPVLLLLAAFLCLNLVSELDCTGRLPNKELVFSHRYGWPFLAMEKHPILTDEGWLSGPPDGYVETVEWTGLVSNVALVVGLLLFAALATSWLAWRIEKRRPVLANRSALSRIPWVGVATALALFAGLLAINVWYEFVETRDQYTPLHTYGWPFIAVHETWTTDFAAMERRWHCWNFAGDVMVGLAISLAGGTFCELLFRLPSKFGIRRMRAEVAPSDAGDTRSPVQHRASFSLCTLLIATLIAGLILWANFKPAFLLWPEPPRKSKMIAPSPERQFGWPYRALRQAGGWHGRIGMKKGVEPDLEVGWRTPDPWDWDRAGVIKNAGMGFVVTLVAALLTEALIRFGAFSRLRRLRRGTICNALVVLVALMATNLVPERTTDVRDFRANYTFCRDFYGWPFVAKAIRHNGTLNRLYWRDSWWYWWGLAGNLAVAAALIFAVGAAWELAPRMARGATPKPTAGDPCGSAGELIETE